MNFQNYLILGQQWRKGTKILRQGNGKSSGNVKTKTKQDVWWKTFR